MPRRLAPVVRGAGRRSVRGRAGAVVLAAVLLVVSVAPVDAGADPVSPTTPPSTDATTPSTVEGEDPAPESTDPDEATTTTDPDAPPVTAGPGGFGGPQIDPDAPPEPPMPDPSPQVRVLLDQLLSQKHERLVVRHENVVESTRLEVEKYLGAERRVRNRLADDRRALELVDARIDANQRDLRADALARYMSPGASGIEQMIDANDDSVRTRAVLSDVTIGLHRQARVDALAQRRTVLARIDRDEKALRRAEKATGRARTRARLARLRAELEAEKAAAEQRLIDIANQRNATARAAVLDGPAAGWSLPIAGQSVFTATELADWFVQRGFPSRAGAPIEDLARFYVDEGDDQGIRGDMAFAQSILETGSFTNRDTILLNNFAGIGHCDTCAQGFAFATPELGVRAQIQLLSDYSQPRVELAHPLVDRRLHGPSGCCQTWWQLTHTWATAGNYGPKIMGIYREMLYWLVVRRGMVPRVGPR